MYKYLLLGYGKSNKSIKKYFDLHNIKYIIYDDFTNKNQINFEEIDYVIKSNGISNNHHILNNVKQYNENNTSNKQIIILSDLELFYRFFKCQSNRKIIVVTGTNGKSTTVSLVKHIISNINLCGNIGDPLFNYLDEDSLNKDVIIEASSFMGEYLKWFSPDISCYLGINNHHLDHHITLENYIKCKENIIKQTKRCICYNYDDYVVSKYVESLNCNRISYSTKSLFSDIYLLNNNIYYKEKLVLSLDNKYNNLYVENIMASIGICLSYGVAIETIRAKINTFKTLEHRLELFKRYNNINIINDSKSTNIMSLIKAISLMKSKTLLICGGKTEQINIDTINIESINIKNIKYILINGENRYILKSIFSKYVDNIILYETLDELLNNIIHYIYDVDTILFSPGSQSYDQFDSFEERGRFFKNKIEKMLNM